MRFSTVLSRVTITLVITLAVLLSKTCNAPAPTVIVSTFAGSGNMISDEGQGNYSSGSTNGQDISASLQMPEGIAVDSSGNLFVTDVFNDKIRKINSTGYVSTIAGSGSPGYNDGQGNYYSGSTNGQGISASFSRPIGIAVDSSGNLFVTDADNKKIRKINSAGYVSTIAGSGSPVSNDGQGNYYSG